MENFYKDLDMKYCYSDQYIIEDINCFDALYGEVEPSTINKIIDLIDFNNKKFIDIGCGLGKTVIQVIMESNAILSDGCEIIKHRYDIAKNIKNKLNDSKKELVNFYHCDFNLLNLEKYDIYFINNLSWTPTNLKKLEKTLNNSVKHGNVVISLKELYFSLNHTLKILKLPMSWNENIETYIYHF